MKIKSRFTGKLPKIIIEETLFYRSAILLPVRNRFNVLGEKPIPIIKENVYGGSNVGVYCVLTNTFLLHPPKFNPKISEFLQVNLPSFKEVQIFMGGAAVVGSLIAANDFGMIVPSTIKEDEITLLQKQISPDYSILAIEAESNAFGNLILCNNHGAIISSQIEEARDEIQKALKVPTQVLDFAGSDLPGSCAVANNKGVLVHPAISEDDANIIARTLDVEIDVSTVNCGNPYLGGGALVNDSVVIFGNESTGPEIQRFMEILGVE